MASFGKLEFENHRASRLLHVLNQAKSVDDIKKGLAKKSEERQGYSVGEKVLERLIDKKQGLGEKGFQVLEDLDKIEGLGDDKVKDLISDLSPPAAEAFQSELYSGIILDNWEVKHATTIFNSKESFLEIVENRANFTDWVANEVVQLSAKRFDYVRTAELAGAILKEITADRYEDPHFGSLAFAFWFYQIDADNWFSFETIWSTCEAYLNYYPYDVQPNRIEFRLFRGFENEGILANPVTTKDLPVVVNYPEQAISIWTAQLND